MRIIVELNMTQSIKDCQMSKVSMSGWENSMSGWERTSLWVGRIVVAMVEAVDNPVKSSPLNPFLARLAHFRTRKYDILSRSFGKPLGLTCVSATYQVRWWHPPPDPLPDQITLNLKYRFYTQPNLDCCYSHHYHHLHQLSPLPLSTELSWSRP